MSTTRRRATTPCTTPRRRSSPFLPQYKILLLGDPAVGKSNLINRFANDSFDPLSSSTIGVEFVSREVDLSCTGLTVSSNFSPVTKCVEGDHTNSEESPSSASSTSCRVVMQLWDTAGQDAHNILAAAYFRGARGAAIVYDVTRRASLLNVGRWVSRVRELCSVDCVVVVIGNKTDLLHDVEVHEDEAAAYCHSLDCRHFSASALSGEGVQNAFLQLLLSVHAVSVARGVANPLPRTIDLNQAKANGADLLDSHAGTAISLSGFRVGGLAYPTKKRGACCMSR